MPDKDLTIERSLADFKKAYRNKRKLIERQKEDFRFALGNQWDAEKAQKLREKGIEPVTDNRIAPNIFLLTGLERQNRSEFKAFPEGEEDSIKAEVASHLFKHAIKISEYGYESSDQFKDGVTCGESHLELYLDYTYNILNGKPCWRKLDCDQVFPGPHKKYDFSDAPHLYKLTLDLSKDDLIGLFPEMDKEIEKASGGKIDFNAFTADGTHLQKKDYPKEGGESSEEEEEECFDLIERYYKKWSTRYYVGDRQTGQIQEAEDKDKATEFVANYQNEIAMEQEAFALAQQQAAILGETGGMVPPSPAPRDPKRFFVFNRNVPEIWYFAHTPGVKKPLADEQAWFYPKWKSYPIVPYFARFSTAPITGDDKHLLVQGIVHGLKGSQKKHNSAETLMLMHLNGSANSGWISEEDSWVDPKKVEHYGATPSVNLEYKVGKPEPKRIFPMALSQGHQILSQETAEAIKAQSGINADLLSVQEGGQASGRAIALRQKQGVVMVQEPFDNKSRTTKIAGKFLLSQLGEIYDTETAKKVLGEAFLTKNFPPPLMMDESGQLDPNTGLPAQVPMPSPKTGQPMTYDEEMAELAIAEVLSGDLGQYDMAVGESVASDTMRMANSEEVKEFAQLYPGLIPPDLLIEESQMQQSTKKSILGRIKQAQAAAANQPPVAA